VISKHLSRLAALLLAFLAVVATAAPLPEVRLLRAPDGGLQPQAIEDAKGALHLIYLKGEPGACDVFYVVRAAGQTNFSAPLRVNRRPGSAVALGTIRGAQLALGRNGRVHVAWNGSVKSKTDSVKSSPMCYARLDDAGNAFEPERNLITTTAALDGGGSVAADEKGNVFVVWHASPVGAAMEEANRAVFLARSTDDGKTFAPERMVSPKSTGACGCCGLKAFVDSHGRIGVLYRAATGGTERDVTLLMSRDAGNSFTNLVVGPWHLTACPMSSMALAQGFGDSWLAAWETAGQIQVGAVMPSLWSCGVSEPEGKGKRKYPVVAVSENHGRRQLTAWVEDAGWARGGPLVWELTDFETTQKSSGRVAGVPVWSLITAVANKDGGFTIIY
jgi:hypothetical protein